MNTYCPNLSNAQVRQEFNDLVQAVGEDQAYLVWHRNNGYALTSAPNGAKSLLFQKLLEKYHGDYNLAMQKKAAMYLSKYTDQNGKWYEGTIFTANNIDNIEELKHKYPSTLPNKFYHHSTNKFGRQPFDSREGTKERLHIVGRLITDKVDALVVENPNSDNKISHITLATAAGIKPFESNKELQLHQDKIQPLDDYVDTTFRNNISNDVSIALDENGEPALVENKKRVPLIKSGISEKDQQKLNNANSFIKNHLQIKSGPIRNKKIDDRLQTLNDYIEWLYYDITGQDLNIDANKDVYDQIEFAVNNTDFEQITKEHLKNLKDSQIKPNSAQIVVRKSLIDSFLSNPDLSKYDEEQKQIIKKFLPALFKSEDSLTNKRIGFYKHNIKKIHDKIDKSFDQEWQTYFANRGKQIKLQNFLDYLELSPDYKQQIKEKIFSEIGRYVARSDSKYFQNKNQKKDLTFMSDRGHGPVVQSLDFSKYFDNSTFEVSKYGRIIYGRAKTSNVLQKIINDNSIDPRLRKSAEFLLKYVKDNQNFDIIFTDPGDRTLFEEGKRTRTVHGVTDTMSRTIYIRTTNAYENKESTLIHEIAHSVTTTILYEQQTDNTKVWKGLESYMRYIDRFVGHSLAAAIAENHWRQSPQEFIAEFFGNAEFQEMLKEIPPVDQKKFNNVFEELLNWLYELFTGKPANAFEQIKPVMESLVISQANRDLIDNVPIYEQRYLESPHFGTQEERHILEHAKRDENGKLLAPNGKPSNLTEKQYAQVRTKAFKEWFGDWENDPKNASKVVDENGEPLVVQHNSTFGDITYFDKNRRGSNGGTLFGKGFYFSTNADYNSIFGKNVYDVFLNIKNPLSSDKNDPSYHIYEDYKLDIAFGDEDDTQTLLKNKGYDGVVAVNKSENNVIEYVAWDSNQIKSATGNVGTFSRTNIDIYYLQTSGNTQDVLTNLFSNDNIDIFLKSGNTQQLLQELINDSYIAAPFKPFAEILARHDIPIIISEENSNNLMSTFVDNNGGVVISINPKVLRHVSIGFAAEKLMHEVVHALTTEGLREGSSMFDRKLNKITEKLFNLYNKQFPSERFSRNDYTNGYNGLQDKYEFVAEFLTNQSFRQLLFDKAKQLDKNNNKQSVLQSLKSFVQNLINFLINKKSNTENLEKYQLQLFNYINNKNTIVNGNIKSEQQLKDLIKSVDTYKFIAENVLENDELLQKLHPVVKRYNFTLGASIINRFIQNNSEYQKRLKDQKNKKERRVALLRQDVKESFNIVIPEIIQALETRQKAVKIAKIPDDQKHKILSGLASQISALKSETMSDLNRIAYVLNAVLPEIIDESEKIHDAAVTLYKDGVYVLSDTDYMYEMHDYFGVYQNVLNSLLDVFTHPGINEAIKEYESDNLSLLSSLNDFIEKVETCKSLCDTSINILKNICSANVIARLENIGFDTNNISEADDYISSELGAFTTHDISWLGKNLGSADASSDYAVKSLSYIVSKAISSAEITTNNKVAKLQMLQHDLKFGESVRQLYELDDNGLPTGNLVRKLNYGKFKSDYNKFMENLNSKYSTDEEPLDPSNRIPPKSKENRIKWQTERNEWLGAHCHRRFNAEYYNKFAQLSDITKQRRDEIQIAINAIRSKVLLKDGSFYDYSALDPDSWQQLKVLYMQRRQLANIYDVTGELKQGDDLIIAQELQELNKSLYDGNKAKRNTNKWQTLRNKVIAECGGLEEMKKGRSNINFDWKKLDEWDERNSKTQFKLNDDGTIKLFDDIRKAKIELLEKNGFSNKQIEDLLDGDSTYNQNKDRINKMLAPYRRLDTGDVDANILPELIKQKVIALQKENGKILKDSKATLKKQIRKKLSELGKEYYDIKWTQQFADMLAEARRLDIQEQTKDGVLSVDDNQNTHVKNFLVTHGFLKLYGDGFGGILEKFTPYQFYTKIVPKDYDKYVEVAPGDNYIEQDPESTFLDKDFDQDENETYIPKINGTYNGVKFSYDNSEAFETIQNSNTLNALYNEIKATIHETNEIYSNIPFKNDFQLPGITGTDWRNLIKRSSGGKWKSLFKDRIGRMFRITEKDVDINQKAATRPDGHQLSFIPQPYTAALKDPTQISMDLIGIVSQYYAKGQQYKEKTNVKDQCETILDLISRRSYVGTHTVKSGLETNTYQMARKFLNMNLYDQREDKAEVGSFNINKPFGFAKAWATLVNLGCSIKVATVGFMTAYYSGIMNAVTGKEYGIKEWSIANAEMLNGLLMSGCGARIIGQNSRLFQQNLMELFNLADQAEKKYKYTNRNVVVNQLIENWAFGMLSTADYLSKGTILDATLAAHRYFEGKFVSKNDIRRLYSDKNSITGGDKYQEALEKWRQGKTFLQVLKEAHKNGDRTNMFNIPSEYKDAVNNSFFYIQKRAQNYAARADGVMTPTQRAAFMTGMIGQAVMMHKQYLQPLLQQYFGAKQYNLEMQQYTYGGIRAVADLLVNPYKDGIQAIRLLNSEHLRDLSEVTNKQKIKAFARGVKSGISRQIAETFADPINRQAIKRVLAEVAIYNLLISPLVSMLLHKADDDRDNKLLQLIAYIALSFRWEAFNQYRFADILNTMKSPTAMTSVWDGLNVFADSFNSYKTPENSLWHVFSNVKDVVTDSEEGNEIIQSGAYEDWTKRERALIKLTPLKNLKEQWDNSYAKRKYTQNQLYKQSE